MISKLKTYWIVLSIYNYGLKIVIKEVLLLPDEFLPHDTKGV